MYNTISINPIYAGSEESSHDLNRRTQFIVIKMK